MTVQELIEELSTYPPDSPVVDSSFQEIESIKDDIALGGCTYCSQPVVMLY